MSHALEGQFATDFMNRLYQPVQPVRAVVTSHRQLNGLLDTSMDQLSPSDSRRGPLMEQIKNKISDLLQRQRQENEGGGIRLDRQTVQTILYTVLQRVYPEIAKIRDNNLQWSAIPSEDRRVMVSGTNELGKEVSGALYAEARGKDAFLINEGIGTVTAIMNIFDNLVVEQISARRGGGASRG